jgi:hypothetical protein
MSRASETLRAFVLENTRYNDNEIDDLYESSLSRVYAHTQNRNIGIITAHRGGNTPQENHERNRQLRDDLTQRGFGYIPIKGRYIENYGSKEAKPVDEHSFLVVGKQGHDNNSLKGNLRSLGKKYGQESVLYKPHDSENAKLLGTKEGTFPGLGEEHDVGKWHPNRTGEFHSLMRGSGGKRIFKFESTGNTHTNMDSYVYYVSKSFFNRMEHLY